MPTIKSYQDLEVWKRAMDLVEECYRVSEKFPRTEEFGLQAQLRRSAVSIPSNIAEGHGRSTTGDYLRHLAIAHGSLMELETQLLIAARLQYLGRSNLDDLLKTTDELSRMLTALIKRLRERATGRVTTSRPSALAPRSSPLP